jgi:ribonucleoside-diphosphate reductase alpha chain
MIPRSLKWRIPQPLVDTGKTWGRPEVDWEGLVAEMKRHGIRNAAQTTVAPTGTIATVSGVKGTAASRSLPRLHPPR